MRGPPQEAEGGKWVSDEEDVKEGLVEIEEDEEASGVSLALGGAGAICFVPIMADWLPPSLPDAALLLLLLLLLLLFACLIVWGSRKDQRL